MNNKKGITLIALIITIIVLLILAGISISAISGEDGMISKAGTAKEKSRAGEIKDIVGLTVSNNKIAEVQGESITTKEELVSQLVEQELLTPEEESLLENQDVITIEGITIDFSQLKDDGFDYLGRKYFLSGIGYTIFNEGSDMILYDYEDNILGQIPASCMTYNAKLITISGTGDYDGSFKISDDDHYVYVIGNTEEYLIGVEEGYCTHYFENSSNWVTWNFDDLENPKIYCDTCWTELPCKYINGVIYAHNVSLDLVMQCVDACYDPSINGWCALVWDKTLETINFENQIDGIDVTRIAGVQDITDDNIPAVKNVTLPNKVKDLSSAFYNCAFLEAVPEIPNTVTNMRGTFSGCASITDISGINIPNKVESLDGTFSGCTSITDISSVNIPNTVTSMNYTFSGCTSILQLGSFNIPSNVTSINSIFYGCTSLTDISDFTISNSVTNMNYAFKNCTSLLNVNGLIIPDSVTTMNYAFEECASLVDASGMTLSKNVTSMNDIFAECSNLTKAPIIPDSVIEMSSAFYNCKKLETISKIPENVTRIHAAFTYCTSLSGKISVPCSVGYFAWASCGASPEYYHTSSCTGNCGH